MTDEKIIEDIREMVFANCITDIADYIEDKLQKQREKIEHIINKEQFKGTRGYTEGCVCGIEAIKKYFKSLKEGKNDR